MNDTDYRNDERVIGRADGSLSVFAGRVEYSVELVDGRWNTIRMSDLSAVPSASGKATADEAIYALIGGPRCARVS